AGAMIDFILLAQIPKQTRGNLENSSSWGTLDWMEWNLKTFHSLKYVFVMERASVRQRQKAREQAREYAETGDFIQLRATSVSPFPPTSTIPYISASHKLQT